MTCKLAPVGLAVGSGVDFLENFIELGKERRSALLTSSCSQEKRGLAPQRPKEKLEDNLYL